MSTNLGGREPVARRSLAASCLDGLLILLLLLAGLYGSARLALQPQDAAAGVAVLFAPWVAGEDALRRSVAAGARFVRHGAYPFIAIVQPDDADYAARASSAGALLIADPQALTACLRNLGMSGVR